MTLQATVLVVAKAPVPGLAKTRLAVSVGDRAAADIAAAALLDMTSNPVDGTTDDLIKITGWKKVRNDED